MNLKKKILNEVKLNIFAPRISWTCPSPCWELRNDNGIYIIYMLGAGAHTLGVARCSSFKNRLSNFDSTHDVDPDIDTQFLKTLSKTCKAGDNAEQPFDSTRNTFDNNYYNGLQRKVGLLSSDQTLFASARTRGIVNGYAMNQAMFFFDFQQAMVKMGLLDVLESPNGEVRRNCRQVNNWSSSLAPSSYYN